jgi:hypothetical protein
MPNIVPANSNFASARDIAWALREYPRARRRLEMLVLCNAIPKAAGLVCLWAIGLDLTAKVLFGV